MIDAIPAGVSGDKYLGALIALGGKPSSLERVGKTVAANLPGTKKIRVEVRESREETSAPGLSVSHRKTRLRSAKVQSSGKLLWMC